MRNKLNATFNSGTEPGRDYLWETDECAHQNSPSYLHLSSDISGCNAINPQLLCATLCVCVCLQLRSHWVRAKKCFEPSISLRVCTCTSRKRNADRTAVCGHYRRRTAEGRRGTHVCLRKCHLKVTPSAQKGC